MGIEFSQSYTWLESKEGKDISAGMGIIRFMMKEDGK